MLQNRRSNEKGAIEERSHDAKSSMSLQNLKLPSYNYSIINNKIIRKYRSRADKKNRIKKLIGRYKNILIVVDRQTRCVRKGADCERR